MLALGNCCYVAVCSAAGSAPTGGGEGRGHIVAAARLQLLEFDMLILPSLSLESDTVKSSDRSSVPHKSRGPDIGWDSKSFILIDGQVLDTS